MGRRTKPAKAKVQGKRPPAPKAPKTDDARAHDLEKKRLAEALDREHATGEILRVISTSPADTQPVFEAIVRNAVRLCGAIYGTVNRSDGTLIHSVAYYNLTSRQIEQLQRTFPRPVSDRGPTARAIRTGGVVRVADLEVDPELHSSDVGALLRARGVRSVLIVPMLRQQQAIGSINLGHTGIDAFTDTHVELLKTFADQAVIAIENVRLFNETKEALDRQTATSEILRVISSSPTDVQPVFDAIVRSAVTLCGAILGAIYRRDGGLVRLVGLDPRYPHAGEVRAAYPAPVTSTLMSCRAIHENAIIQLPDTETPGVLPAEGLRLARLSGFRSVVAVPMRREGEPMRRDPCWAASCRGVPR